MANTARSGSGGTAIALGFQPLYGSRINANSDMIPRLFPCSTLDIDEDSETVENNLINAFGAAPPVEVGKFWCQGSAVSKILYEEIIHFLRGILVPAAATSTQLALTAGSSFSGSGTVTPTNTEGKPTLSAATFGKTGVRWPSRLVATYSGTPGTGATMLVKGKRIRGRDESYDLFYDEETIPLTGTSDEGKIYWHEVDEVVITGLSGSVDFTFNPNRYRTQVKFQTTNPRFKGYTGLLLKGGSPGVARDLLLTELLISASETAIDIAYNFIGTRYDRFQTIEGGQTPKVKLSDADRTYFVEPKQDYAQGWASEFKFGENTVKYTSIDVGIALNLGPEPGVDGSSFRKGATSEDNRQVTFNPTPLFTAPEEETDTYIDFQKYHRNDTRLPLIFESVGFDSEGGKRQVEWSTPSGKVASSPRVGVTGPGAIEEPLEFQALSSTDDPSEITATIISENDLTFTI